MQCRWFGFFFVKQKTAYEMRISDLSSDVCSSDLPGGLSHHLRMMGGMDLWYPPNDQPHLLEWWRPLLLASRAARVERFPWPLHIDEVQLVEIGRAHV